MSERVSQSVTDIRRLRSDLGPIKVTSLRYLKSHQVGHHSNFLGENSICEVGLVHQCSESVALLCFAIANFKIKITKIKIKIQTLKSKLQTLNAM